MATVLFLQPNSPEEFGVVLAPAELRKLDFSALDFNTLNRAGIEYIRTYFPNDFNDFFASNGIIMMLELVAYVGNVLAEREDILVDEAFFPTCQTKNAAIQHMALIDQEFQRATPANADVQITLTGPAPTEVKIPAGIKFTLNGPDGQPVNFEVFRAPGDFTSQISIPPGKRGIVAFAIEGVTSTPLVVTSAGGQSQMIDLLFSNVLDQPISVEVATGNSAEFWTRVDIIEKSLPTAKVFEVKHLSDRTRIVFGDDTAGKSPLSGQVITVVFRTGGGIRGRIAANQINETRPVNPEPPANAAIEALFQNPFPSSGGTDEETLDEAKRRAPREFATHNNAVTGEDYGLLAEQYTHPVFGAVAKGVAIVRTGVDQDLLTVSQQVRAASSAEAGVTYLTNNYINRNIVEVYVLSQGPGGILDRPSSGLKQGLVTYLSDINSLTDEVRVFDGAVKPVDITASVIISRNQDAGTVKAAVTDVINNFFNLNNFDMGTGMYLSNLYQAIQAVAGVKFVDILKPSDDILSTNMIADPKVQGVGFNEVITLGQVNVQFFFEQGPYRVPPSGKI